MTTARDPREIIREALEHGVVPQQGAAAYASLLSSMREAVTS